MGNWAQAALTVGLGLTIAGCSGSSGHGAVATAAGVTSSASGAVTSGGTAPSGSSTAPVSSGFTPSDDPNDWVVDTRKDYDPVIGTPRWVVPSPALPAQTPCLASNNNVAICFHAGRLFLAWRTAETHFASANASMNIVSSTDMGRTWEFEARLAFGADTREPGFVSLNGKLHFTCFEAGTNPLAFEPRHVWRITRRGLGSWTQPVSAGDPSEVPWEVKVRNGVAYRTSYKGNHYGTGPSAVAVHFERSTDGTTWTDVDPQHPVLYSGGVSEVGWELDEHGDFWAVGRNEDGDASGWGSLFISAPAGHPTQWTVPAQSDPERYDSPRMFRHGDDLYLIARRDVGGPFDMGMRGFSFEVQKWLYLGAYSARPKRTALYRIDRVHRQVVHLMDLPGTGDTAFPSVWRIGAHRFLVANYTSPLPDPNVTWIQGQLSSRGTRIYLLEITFVPR